MQASVIKTFFDIATKTTYKRGTSYEVPSLDVAEKLEKDGFIKIEKVEPTKKANKKKEAR